MLEKESDFLCCLIELLKYDCSEKGGTAIVALTLVSAFNCLRLCAAVAFVCFVV